MNGESTKATVGGACSVVTGLDNVNRGLNSEHSAVESHVYIHARVAWDYHLHVNQLANSNPATCVPLHRPLKS